MRSYKRPRLVVDIAWILGPILLLHANMLHRCAMPSITISFQRNKVHKALEGVTAAGIDKPRPDTSIDQRHEMAITQLYLGVFHLSGIIPNRTLILLDRLYLILIGLARDSITGRSLPVAGQIHLGLLQRSLISLQGCPRPVRVAPHKGEDQFHRNPPLNIRLINQAVDAEPAQFLP